MLKPFKVLMILMLACSNAAAQSDWDQHPWLHAKWRLMPGLSINSYETQFRVNGNDAIDDPDIDFSDTFKTGNSDSRLQGELLWRFGEKWSVALQYIGTDERSVATLDEDIEWEDFVLREGTSVAARFESNIYRVFFGRKFVDRPRHQFGLGVGFHWLDFSLFAEGEFFLDDGTSVVGRESVSAAAPLPNLGAWYDHAFNERWALTSRLDFLSASIDEYSGSIANLSVGVNYQAWENVAFGVNYNYFDINVDVDKRGWQGGVEYEVFGPFLFANITW